MFVAGRLSVHLACNIDGNKNILSIISMHLIIICPTTDSQLYSTTLQY